MSKVYIVFLYHEYIVNGRISHLRTINRGLLIRNLELVNKGMLINTPWRLVHNSNYFVAMIIISKYYPHASLWTAATYVPKLTFWSSILSIRYHLEQNVTIQFIDVATYLFGISLGVLFGGKCMKNQTLSKKFIKYGIGFLICGGQTWKLGILIKLSPYLDNELGTPLCMFLSLQVHD